jgi:hypothetical protein
MAGRKQRGTLAFVALAGAIAAFAVGAAPEAKPFVVGGTAQAASAAPQARLECFGPDYFCAFRFSGTPSAEVLRVSRSSVGRVWRFRSPPRVEAVGPECKQVGPAAADCANPNRVNIEVYGSRGNDRIRSNTAHPIDAEKGGPGDDLLVGSRSDDRYFLGGTGDDVMRGRAGYDYYLANAGDDEIHAADSERDWRINCGRGGDVAYIDAVDREPQQCETVIVRP